MWQQYAPTAVGTMTMINVKDFGAIGDGVFNNVTAIQNAIAAAIAGQGGRGVDLYFPSGIYAINGPVAVVGNNVMLRGAGWLDTILLCTITTGDVLQFGNGGSNDGCGMMDMSVWKQTVNGASGSNININGMNNCYIGNFDISQAFTGITIQGSSIKVWINQGRIDSTTATTGIGIQVTNGLAGDTYIRNVVMSNGATPPLAGIAVTQSGHIEIIGCNVTKATTGLLINPTGTQLANYGFVEYSLFDSCLTYAMNITPSGAATAKVQNWMFIDSWFSGSTGNPGTGIQITTASSAIVDGLSFIGCRILNNFSNGVSFPAAGPQNISFTDCTISGNSQGSSGALDGVNIATNVNSLTFMNCKIGQQGTAGNTQRFAINLTAGSSAGMQFIGNDCQPNVTVGNRGYLNIGAITGGGNIIEMNNPSVPKNFGTSRAGATGAITTVETLVSDTTAQRNRLLANALVVGTHIRATIFGTYTVTTGAGTWTCTMRMGTGNVAGDAAILALAAQTTGATPSGPIVFKIIIDCTIRTLTTCFGYFTVQENAVGAAGLNLIATKQMSIIQGTASAVTATQANYVNVTMLGSTNCSITVQDCIIECSTP